MQADGARGEEAQTAASDGESGSTDHSETDGNRSRRDFLRAAVIASSAAVAATGSVIGVASLRNWSSPMQSFVVGDAQISGNPAPSGLSLDKVTDTLQGTTGDLMTYVITVTNNGASAVSGVSVTDLLPDGVLFHDAIPSQGSYNANSGNWSVGTLGGTTTATMYLEVQITALSGVITNTASLPGGATASAQTTVS